MTFAYRRTFQTAMFCLLTTLRVASATDIVRWRGDLAHQGQNREETILKPSSVNDRLFGKLFAYPIDGQAYAQPLYLANLAIPNKGTRNVVYVATEHDSVFAFDADAGGVEATLWHVNFLDSAHGITTIAPEFVHSQDILPEIGITGTPTIDRETGTLYVVSRTHEIRSVPTTFPSSTIPSQATGKVEIHNESHWVQKLHALDITTGAEKFNGPVEIGDTAAEDLGGPFFNHTDVHYHGHGAGSKNGDIAFNALTANQRPGLIIDHGILYVDYASHGDQPPCHGWLLAYDPSNLKLRGASCFTPDGAAGTAWMAGSTPAIDSNGDLFVVTGNGDSTVQSGRGQDYSECVMHIRPFAPGRPPLEIVDWFSPADYALLNDNDLDFGSGGILMLPDQPGEHPHELIVAGKEGVVFVLDRDHLGGLESKEHHAVQTLPDALQAMLDVNHNEINVINTAAYFGNWVYYTSRSCPLSQFKLVNGKLSETPLYQAKQIFNFTPPTPTISSNGDRDAIVWVVNNGTPAQLLAYDATDVRKLLYDSNALGSRDQLAAGVKFTVPTVVNGKVFVATQTELEIFGPLPPVKVRPDAPTNLLASAASPSEIDLTWPDDRQRGTCYRVERAPEGGEFAEITVTGPDVGGYVDRDPILRQGQAYRYRVRATNAGGDSKYSPLAEATTLSDSPDPSLVGHWALDEGTGNATADSADVKGAGEIHGEVTWVRGRVGTAALGFHGAGVAPSFVSIPDSSAIRFNADASFTVSAWVNSSTPIGKWTGYVTHAGVAPGGYGFWCDKSGRWVCGVFTGAAQEKNNLTGPAIEQGWHLLTLTQDGGSHERTFYLDAKPVATGAAIAADAPGDLWIGGASGNEHVYTDARVDEVRIYNRALPPAQITSLAQRHNPESPARLAAVARSGSAVDLSWMPSDAGGETGFRIERASDGTHFTQVAKAPAGVNHFTDSNDLVAATSYTYRVRATNASGDSPDSDVAAIVFDVPAAPSKLTSKFEDGGAVSLAWTLPPVPSDPAEKATGKIAIQLQRSTDAKFTADLITITLPGDAVTYHDATPPVRCYYRLRSTNVVGMSPPIVVPINKSPTTAPTTAPILITSVTEKSAVSAAVVRTGLAAQSEIYCDRPYAFQAVKWTPIDLNGAEWIQTANANKAQADYSLTFKLSRRCEVYVLVPDSSTPKPGTPVGTENFEMTNAMISAGAAGLFRALHATLPAGAYTLGPQHTDHSFYVVVALPG